MNVKILTRIFFVCAAYTFFSETMYMYRPTIVHFLAALASFIIPMLLVVNSVSKTIKKLTR